MAFGLGRKALGLALLTFLLAGCGGAQNAGAPQGAIGSQSLGHSGRWMLPEAKGEDLLYVSNQVAISVPPTEEGRGLP